VRDASKRNCKQFKTSFSNALFIFEKKRKNPKNFGGSEITHVVTPHRRHPIDTRAQHTLQVVGSLQNGAGLKSREPLSFTNLENPRDPPIFAHYFFAVLSKYHY